MAARHEGDKISAVRPQEDTVVADEIAAIAWKARGKRRLSSARRSHEHEGAGALDGHTAGVHHHVPHLSQYSRDHVIAKLRSKCPFIRVPVGVATDKSKTVLETKLPARR